MSETAATLRQCKQAGMLSHECHKQRMHVTGCPANLVPGIASLVDSNVVVAGLVWDALPGSVLVDA